VAAVAEPVGGEGAATAQPKGQRISLDELKAQEQTAPPPPQPGLESDLDSLRQTVETPERRGWFGRKK
jgi:hypothetical protein